MEGGEHVLEEGLLHPRGSVGYRTTLHQGTGCREIPRESMHQQFRPVPDWKHEACGHVRPRRIDRGSWNHGAKGRRRVRVLRRAALAAPQAFGNVLQGRSAAAQPLLVPNRWSYLAENARESDG